MVSHVNFTGFTQNNGNINFNQIMNQFSQETEKLGFHPLEVPVVPKGVIADRPIDIFSYIPSLYSNHDQI